MYRFNFSFRRVNLNDCVVDAANNGVRTFPIRLQLRATTSWTVELEGRIDVH